MFFALGFLQEAALGLLFFGFCIVAIVRHLCIQAAPKAQQIIKDVASDPDKAEGAVRVAKTGVRIARMILTR